MLKPEDLRIEFKPGEIHFCDSGKDPISVIPCREKFQMDVYLYLLGSLTETIQKAAEGFKRLSLT